MKTSRLALLLILCLSLLSACATNMPPPKDARKTPITDACTPTGSTRTVLAPARVSTPQGDWSMFHGDIRRSGAAVKASASKLALAWSYCTGAPISSSPIVHAGIVYIGSLDETLTALDIRSGEMLWQVQADDQFYSTPAIVNGVVYAASLSELYAIDARTGFVHWSEHVETENGKFWSSPAVTHGLVIIGLASNLSEKPKIAGRVLAFDAKTGKVRWRTYTSSRGAPGAGVWSSPAVDEQRGIVYVATGDPDDGVQALALRNGHLLWHWRSVTRDVAD
ncbi:MAG TPA: PQQ-binding-like beta-propeller repeat protein, partial [Ktedonobacteraceae bacterium]|nr:PQQ-binding-like beta-propeller repeat protein [Ktedonobacteraceae bacterium]